MLKNVLFICMLGVFLATYSQSPPQIQIPKYSVQYVCPPCGCSKDGQLFDAPAICSECNMAYTSQLTGMEDKPRNTISRKTAAIVLFNGADIMDVTGPMSVFEHAGFNVITVAKNTEAKAIGMYMRLSPDYTFANLPQVDIIMVPGGGAAESNQDMEIVQWLKERAGETDTMFSVCSGAFFLGLAGLLDGNEATTFASLIPNLKAQFPNAKVLNDVKYTNNGHIITSSGLSSGIDASFEVVAKYYGVGRAQDVANRMEYPWKRKQDYARSQLADNFILSMGDLVRRFATKYHFSEGDMTTWEYKYVLWEGVDIDEFMKFMGNEFQKLPEFTLEKETPNEFIGEYTHPVLGRGQVELILQSTDEGVEASLRARRKQPYNF